MKSLSLAIALVLNATQGHAEAAYNADFVHELVFGSRARGLSVCSHVSGEW